MALAHLTMEFSLMVAHVEAAAFRALYQLVARFASNHWLGCQDGALVMHRCRVVLIHGVG